MANKLTLAITTIGDLFLESKISMAAEDKQSKDIKPITDVKLRIPNYQRPYKWTAKNANQLFDDINEARVNNKEVYRVGTLILYENKEDGTYEIVDGQQRSITFALLLDCLGAGEIPLLRLELADNQFTVHNVVNNHRALERRIDSFDRKDNTNEKQDMLNYVKNHCELIVVITDDLSEAFQFFDSQNARGKALYPHDLLKAYHLREMNDLEAAEIEKAVKTWEDLDQQALSVLFQDYLYRIKEWVKGNQAYELTEKNLDLFKGISVRDNFPYAQFYKAAYAYAADFNNSRIPFVTGMHKMSPFQLNTPIIAGKPFFEYTKHYFDVLADIQNNDKYEGYFVNDNQIIKTLNLGKYKKGVGNGITRLMLDTAILLYVDRFCPEKPSKADTELLDRFIVFAFIWAYSMRAQYIKVGWQVAQNYIMGKADVSNSFNMYKLIADSDSPETILNLLSDRVMPLRDEQIKANKDGLDQPENDIAQNYLDYFATYHFWEVKENGKQTSVENGLHK